MYLITIKWGDTRWGYLQNTVKSAARKLKRARTSLDSESTSTRKSMLSSTSKQWKQIDRRQYKSKTIRAVPARLILNGKVILNAETFNDYFSWGRSWNSVFARSLC